LPAMAHRLDGPSRTLPQPGSWATAHPAFTAVAPAGMASPFLLAYLLPPDADGLRQYLDQWLELKSNDGFRAQQLDYWIKGKPRAERQAPWNPLAALLAPRGR